MRRILMMQLYNYILTEDTCKNGTWIDNVNPATGEVIHIRSQKEDAEDAILSAEQAFQGEWSQWSSQDRRTYLIK